jgi:hypothetical protein
MRVAHLACDVHTYRFPEAVQEAVEELLPNRCVQGGRQGAGVGCSRCCLTRPPTWELLQPPVCANQRAAAPPLQVVRVPVQPV